MNHRYLVQYQQLQVQGITALDADDTNVFLGTQAGRLLRFVVHREDPHSEASSFTYLLASEQDASENAPVKKILLLADVQLVAVLANETLSFYSLPEFAPASDLRTVKDVQGVIWGSPLKTDTEGEASASLTVFTKRRVRQLLITSTRIKLAREVEYAGCVAACQRGSIVCVATRQAYDLLDLERKARIQLFPVIQGEANPDGPEFDRFVPHIISPSEGEFLVTSGSPEMPNALGMFITMEGDITRGTLMFDDYPVDLIHDGDRVLALLPSGLIEVHNIANQMKEHIIEVQGMTGIMTTSQAIEVVVKENLDIITLVDYAADEEKLSKHVDVARRVSTNSSNTLLFGAPGTAALAPRTRLMKFDTLLDSGDIEGSVKAAAKHYKKRPIEEASHCQAYIHQKAGLLYLKQLLFDDAMDNLVAGAMDPRVLLTLYRSLMIGQDTKDLVTYQGIRTHLSKMQTVEDMIRATLETSVDDPATLTELCTILEGQATEMCRRFLDKYRVQHQNKPQSKGAMQSVEAALLQILLTMDRGEAKAKLEQFFQLELVHVDQAVQLLNQYERWWELLQLYTRLAHHDRALALWQQFMEGTITDRDFPGNGFQAMKDYLIQHGNDELVWKYGVWLLQMYPDCGIELFDVACAKLGSTVSYEALINLLRSREDRATFLKVLNHVVATSAVVDQALSDELILSYAEQVTDRLLSPTVREAAEQTISGYRQMKIPKMPFPFFVFENRAEDFSEQRQFGDLRKKLIDRLQDDAPYDAQAVLDVVEKQGDILLAERSILYGRLGHHAAALKILVHDLQDFNSAEVYSYHGGVSLSSLRVGSQKQEIVEMRYKLFPMLLSECLSFTAPELRFSQSVALLNRWGNYMDFESVLEFIPDEWSIEVVSTFLQRALAHLTSEKRDAQIQRSLVRLQARRFDQKSLIRLER
jgi:hypothetical protein